MARNWSKFFSPNDLIFPGEEICSVCGQKNHFFVIVDMVGTPKLHGIFCNHKNAKVGNLNPKDVLCFLEGEKAGAQKNLAKEQDGERRINIQLFLAQAEKAIKIMRRGINLCK